MIAFSSSSPDFSLVVCIFVTVSCQQSQVHAPYLPCPIFVRAPYHLSERLITPFSSTLFLCNGIVEVDGLCDPLWANRDHNSHALVEEGKLYESVVSRATLAADNRRFIIPIVIN